MTKFAVGDIVRVKSTGQQGTIESINPNPDYQSGGEPWASLSSDLGHNHAEIHSLDDIELVSGSAAAASTHRTIPTTEDISSFVANALATTASDSFRLDGVTTEASQVQVNGRTTDGRPFGFTLTVTDVT